MTNRERVVLPVSELVSRARAGLESAFRNVWVTGEVSNLRVAPSGHLYFSLKDRLSQLRVVLFRSSAAGLRFRLEDGLDLLVCATLGIYEPRGDLQLVALRAEPVGLGSLAVAFQQLRTRLEAEGVFDPAAKRPLPGFPRTIGIVTSPSGAALHDVLQVLERRRSLAHVLIAPTRVQGEGAALEIARALGQLASRPEVDVILLTRGGGSLEDLWPFNEEVVARAIRAAPVPVVSAVGHEIDHTIADFAADARAPTPSAAAELLSPSVPELYSRIGELSARLHMAGRQDLSRRRLRLLQLSTTRALRILETLPDRLGQRLDELAQRLARESARHLAQLRHRLGREARLLEGLHPRRQLELRRERVRHLSSLLEERGRARLARKRDCFARAVERLGDLSPLASLARGYAIATGPRGQILLSSRALQPDDQVRVRLAEGEIDCRVQEVR